MQYRPSVAARVLIEVGPEITVMLVSLDLDLGRERERERADRVEGAGSASCWGAEVSIR